MQLIISEKPDIEAAIATALGARGRRNKYIENSGLTVSRCIGHLASLADAGNYDERFKKWRYDDLPTLSDKWQYILSPGKEEQFAALKDLVKRSDISEMVNACSAGHEGELIFRFICEMVDCTESVSRLRASSMEDAIVRESFGSLKPSIKYEALYQSVPCCSETD